MLKLPAQSGKVWPETAKPDSAGNLRIVLPASAIIHDGEAAGANPRRALPPPAAPTVTPGPPGPCQALAGSAYDGLVSRLKPTLQP